VGHPVQPPCRSRVTQSRLHSTLSRRVLNISREGDSTTSLGSLFQCSITLRGKKKKDSLGSAPEAIYAVCNEESWGKMHRSTGLTSARLSPTRSERPPLRSSPQGRRSGVKGPAQPGQRRLGARAPLETICLERGTKDCVQNERQVPTPTHERHSHLLQEGHCSVTVIIKHISQFKGSDRQFPIFAAASPAASPLRHTTPRQISTHRGTLTRKHAWIISEVSIRQKSNRTSSQIHLVRDK